MRRREQARTRQEDDWVCVRCKNLNYSFRNHCNRCKVQSRTNNEHQAVLLQITMQNQILYTQALLTHCQSAKEVTAEAISPQRVKGEGFRSMLFLTPKCTKDEDQDPECPGYSTPETLPDIKKLLKKCCR